LIDHIGFECSDYARSRAFYAQALEPLGLTLVMEVTRERSGGYEGCGFGAGGKPEFWIGANPASGGGKNRGPTHVAFRAANRGMVDAFYAASLAAGGKDNGAPGIRAHYHPNYYGAFVLDPDGNNIEAVCHSPEPI
jgi:catechol 2,3-dioxygenase-like lactoylglutathione lyase family enzyme